MTVLNLKEGDAFMQEKESFKVRRLKQEAEKRIKVTTTLREDLWKALQVAGIKSGRNANDMIEESIVDILKEPTKRLALRMRA